MSMQRVGTIGWVHQKFSQLRKHVKFTFSAIDTSLIYEGIFLPENNLVVIIQNFYVWAVSSLGLLALIPFYQVRKAFAQCCSVMWNVKCNAMYIRLQLPPAGPSWTKDVAWMKIMIIMEVGQRIFNGFPPKQWQIWPGCWDTSQIGWITTITCEQILSFIFSNILC